MAITLNSTTITGVEAGGISGVPFASGTSLMFNQTTAPVGWTKSTAHDNKALRIVSGTAASGGSVNFTTAFSSKSVTGSVGNTGSTTATGSVNSTTLSEAQMPSHAHTSYTTIGGANAGGSFGWRSATVYTTQQNGTSAAGSSTGHTHGFTGTAHAHSGGSFTGNAIDLAVQYVDAIICVKD